MGTQALTSLLCAAAGSSALGGFWQLTDVHVDLAKECSGAAPNWYGSFDGEYGCGAKAKQMRFHQVIPRNFSSLSTRL